jgi:translation initiation factor 6
LGIDKDRIVETRIADTIILGVMAAGNDKGLLLPRTVKDEEVELIRRSLDVEIGVLDTRNTALGNLILANNEAALIYPGLEEHVEEKIREVLGVKKLEKRVIAHIPTVGSLAVVTGKGGLIHPDVPDEEIKFLSEFFSVPFDVGTVNFGIPFVKTGIIANDKGALVGDQTTGPELMRIQKALGYEEG